MLTRENIQDIYSLSPIQEAMFFHSLYEKESLTYFEQVSFNQQGQLDIALVQKAFNELLRRYDILRTVFIQKTTDRPLQVILKEREIDFYYEDCRQSSDTATAIGNYKAGDKRRSFELGKDVLMRVAVLQVQDNAFEIIWS
jgi:hypothetical protein